MPQTSLAKTLQTSKDWNDLCCITLALFSKLPTKRRFSSTRVLPNTGHCCNNNTACYTDWDLPEGFSHNWSPSLSFSRSLRPPSLSFSIPPPLSPPLSVSHSLSLPPSLYPTYLPYTSLFPILPFLLLSHTAHTPFSIINAQHTIPIWTHNHPTISTHISAAQLSIASTDCCSTVHIVVVGDTLTC